MYLPAIVRSQRRGQRRREGHTKNSMNVDGQWQYGTIVSSLKCGVNVCYVTDVSYFTLLLVEFLALFAL